MSSVLRCLIMLEFNTAITLTSSHTLFNPALGATRLSSDGRLIPCVESLAAYLYQTSQTQRPLAILASQLPFCTAITTSILDEASS